FDEAVTKPLGSQLGGQAISWEGDDEAKGVWNGTADISSVDNTLESLPLTIKGYQDASGNPGAENTDHQFVLQPVVTISEVTVNAGTVTVKGNATHSSNSATLKLTFEDESKNPVTLDKNVNLSDGAFEQTVTFDELSGLASGSVDVTAVVTNGQNASGQDTYTTTL
ncbi:hypothetical protein TW84_17105, partial [Vibrio neptunius]|uniref:hypothetical protein n=1 Tax=Vibrio neptunius TaxID=170651 RepID=UPI0005FA34AB